MRITNRKRTRFIVPAVLAALALMAWYAPVGASAATGGEGSSAPSLVDVLTTPAEPVAPPAAGSGSGSVGERFAAVARSAGRHCQASDLTLVSIEGDGAAGHIAWVVTVANTGRRPCALLGDPAVVVFTDAAGHLVTVPTDREVRPPSGSTLLAPGQRAEMALYMVNGYGGYDPSAPQCAHPVVYRNLSTRIGRTGLLPLTGLVIDLKCDGITAYDWAVPE